MQRRVPWHIASAAPYSLCRVPLINAVAGLAWPPQVCAYLPGAAAGDPLFRVPVMVIKPLAVAEEGRRPLEFPGLGLTPGQLRRLFIAVPPTASWAKVCLASVWACCVR